MPTLFDHFVVAKPDLMMGQLKVSPQVYEELETQFDGFKAHTLISAHHFSESWEMWEKHPAGDELVILLSGRAIFHLKLANGNKSLELKEAGAYAVIPKNQWHTAEIHEPTSMLFITPGEGTLNEADPSD